MTRRHRAGDVEVGHAGLDHHAPIGQLDLEHAAHAAEHDQHALGHRQRAAGQAGARAARHERHVRRVAGAHDVPNRLGARGQHDDARRDRVLQQAVGLVRAPLALAGHHAVLAAGAAQLGQERGGHHARQRIRGRVGRSL